MSDRVQLVRLLLVLLGVRRLRFASEVQGAESEGCKVRGSETGVARYSRFTV